MSGHALPDAAENAVRKLGQVDVVVGIPSYNNARSIGHVVQAAHAGLAKYFPQYTGLIINSDGGSRDGTRDAVLESRVEDSHLLLLNTPLQGVHRLSFPYHGIPGKGSAFRLIFQMSQRLNAKACAVLDADLRSVTPEWIDLLVRPVLHAGFDFVAPYYHRHKYDGTITNSIVYPVTRSLYGKRIRQPIGGDFGLSPQLIDLYVRRDDWETDVARYGIDVWMTTIAVAEGLRVCQSFLGAKLHDAKDPGSELSDMLQQVVGSVFSLMTEYEHIWSKTSGSDPVDLFGFRYDVGLDPIPVNVERMVQAFRRGCQELGEIWEIALATETFQRVRGLLCECSIDADVADFHLDDAMWVRIVYDFAAAHYRRPVERSHILRSLAPLYMARVASFVNETREMSAADVEQRIEQLCGYFEAEKRYLIERWSGEAPSQSPRRAVPKESVGV
jgi:glycosyltransferase involved in cell wall biosynthesis